ncbi:MAG: sigma-70 family RNA polymerase sigma factor, partial [Gemmataceae bacterium]
RRHGPMVLRVCQRVLHDRHAAEDAFQATFLVLSRKAASLRCADSVGCWLHGVASRLAQNARRQRARRHRHESQAAIDKHADDPLAELSVREAQTILDEELARLPEKYRAPLVLCCLEGRTRDEAARQLGWPAKLVKSRLEQGRERLRGRLTRRGLTLPAALVATLLAEEAAPAALPVALMRATVQAALASASNYIAPSVALLAEGVLGGTATVKTKIIVGMLFLAGVLAAGVAALAPPPVADAPGSPPRKVAKTPKAKVQHQARTDRYGDPLPDGAIARIGTIRFRHGSNVFAVSYSPDGKTLAAIGADGVRLWDAATGKQRHSYDRRSVPKDGFFPPAGYDRGFFSADGRCLWLQSSSAWQNSPGKVLYCWKLTPEPEREPKKAPFDGKDLLLLAASPDGKLLAIGEKTTIRLCKSTTGEESRQLKTPAYRARFSADSKILASFDGRSIILWNVQTGAQVRSFRATDRRSSFVSFALAPDGKIVAALSRRPKMAIHLWDTAT